MISVLFLGFLMGIRHALEADHIVAVATLVDTRNSGDAMKQGVVWGIGHTLTLLLICTIAISFDFLITEATSHVLELIVGVMLILLGLDLLRKIYADRPHFHAHKHSDGVNHIHFHVHPERDKSQVDHTGQAHSNQHHTHHHVSGFPLRALFIGLMHGLAGSSVLIILTLKTIHSPLLGFVYIFLFGLGSILSMAIMSVFIAIPVRLSLKNAQWLYGGLRGTIATITFVFGVFIIYESGFVSGLLVL